MAETLNTEMVDTRLDSLIAEIESSDAPIGPVLRSVYDECIQQQFLSKLDDRIKTHDKEIERMCNYNYQGFVESVNELIKVRSDARTLKVQVKKADDRMQSSGGELVAKLEQLESCRVVQKNIAATIETLSLCLPVLEMFSKLKEQKTSKKYYLALRTLEQLEQTYLARSKNFRFTEIMKSQLPAFREGIKHSAMEDLMLFLENVRAKSEKLGSIAMRQAHQQYSLTLLHGVDVSTDDDEEVDLCPADLVDFSPVYRCLHIFTALGEREHFERHYKRERKQQSRLAFDWQSAGSHNIHESLDAFQSYFHVIVGFFLVEDTVMTTTQGVVTRGTVDELWEHAIPKIRSDLTAQCANLEDPEMMLKVKELVVWFSHTLAGYGFSVTALYDLLTKMRDQYNEVLAKKWTKGFSELGSTDNYTSLYIANEEELSILEEFPKHLCPSKDGFPKMYPFSAYVPKAFKQVKEYILASTRFNENLNISRTEIDQAIRKSTNFLLTNVLSGKYCSLKTLIAHPALNLAQLVQISVNTMHLEKACPELEKFISSVTGATEESVSVTKLYGSSTFKDVRAEAEQRIFEKLNSKMDEFFGLSNYNWMPTSQRSHPSEYLVDLIAYLQGAFITFESLPGDVAKTACMSSCKHLATKLKDFLLTDEVKQMSLNGLKAFNLDLKHCEDFVSSKPVEGFEEGMLEMTFVELRQIVNLLLDGDWNTFCTEYTESKETGNRKYGRVTPGLAAKLYEKITDTKKGIAVKKTDRDKKKTKENILKRLRELDAEGRL
eukprot:gene12131-2735_t